MKKRNTIIYLVATLWLAIAMVASGIQQMFSIGGFVEIMDRLEYPNYFSVFIGACKIVAVVVLLLPKFPLWKEWAYAGLFFLMFGAFVSHIAVGDATVELFAPTFLLVLNVVSWYFRPAPRKLKAYDV